MIVQRRDGHGDWAEASDGCYLLHTQAHIVVCFLALVICAHVRHSVGHGTPLRTLLTEMTEVRRFDFLLPGGSGKRIRLRTVSRPENHRALLLERLGLPLPTSQDKSKCSADFWQGNAILLKKATFNAHNCGRWAKRWRVYLGRYDLPKVHEMYPCTVAERLANNRPVSAPRDDIRIVELAACDHGKYGSEEVVAKPDFVAVQTVICPFEHQTEEEWVRIFDRTKGILL